MKRAHLMISDRFEKFVSVLVHRQTFSEREDLLVSSQAFFSVGPCLFVVVAHVIRGRIVLFDHRRTQKKGQGGR